ncbi:MAG: asparagine synthase (glutamine-hydrolyzing) [Blastocatellia bacterium]|nr:asparagine synthase (glutamine-hydrolyzing) [Blastocatellia bacterium]
MCGITGIYNYRDDEPVDEIVLRRMTGTLTHRGPDEDGITIREQAGLGHRRLSIIDVAGGRQPIFNEDGDIAIVFNGEIYNYKELAQLVESRNHRLRTLTDTETIIHLYEEYGEGCVSMLRGMFAFAIWDGRQNRMLLARDRVGKKPLYYSDYGGRFVFGSELKAVIEHDAVPRTIDERAMADYFSFQYIPSPKTIYRHVRKLRPGHLLMVTPSGVTDREYWDIDFSQTEERDEAFWCSSLLDALYESVDLRLMSEVPLGAFLSSGVDSSAIVAMMGRITERRVVTASVGFTEEKYSELTEAREFAELQDTDHHERIITPDAIGVTEKLAWHFDEPFADSSAIPTYYAAQTARKFVKVALSGDGGDENFVGYRRYAFDAFENRVRDIAPSSLRRPLFSTLAAVYPKADWLPQPLRAKSTFRNLSLDPAAAYYNSVYGATANERDELLTHDVQRQLNGYDPFDVFLDHYRRPRTDDPVARAQYVDIKTYLADDILTKVDRASMAVSLEVRCPLLDHRFMSLAARIPSRFKLRGREGKYIFRRAMRMVLPPQVLSRRKKGFVVPLTEWLRGDMQEYAHHVLFDRAASDGLLNQAVVERLWKQHQSGLRDNARPLWTILMFRLWQKNFA